jgi:transcription initiation factor TFIIA small subunit
MATFELYRRSTIGTCLTETLDELVSSGAVSPELAIQVLVQFDKVSRHYSHMGLKITRSLAACFDTLVLLSSVHD